MNRIVLTMIATIVSTQVSAGSSQLNRTHDSCVRHGYDNGGCARIEQEWSNKTSREQSEDSSRQQEGNK